MLYDHIMISLEFIDPATNKIINEGSKLTAGDQILIGIKSESEDLESSDYKIMIENCSISALANPKDTTLRLGQRVDLIKRGCPRTNNMSSTPSLSFRSVGDSSLESNLFEVFKMPGSPYSLLNCWLQVCTIKSKCIPKICPHAMVVNSVLSDQGSAFSEPAMVDEPDESEFLDYISVELRFSVEESHSEPVAKSQQKQVNLPDVSLYYTSNIIVHYKIILFLFE
jgi:hypothetical protein